MSVSWMAAKATGAILTGALVVSVAQAEITKHPMTVDDVARWGMAGVVLFGASSIIKSRDGVAALTAGQTSLAWTLGQLREAIAALGAQIDARLTTRHALVDKQLADIFVSIHDIANRMQVLQSHAPMVEDDLKDVQRAVAELQAPKKRGKSP